MGLAPCHQADEEQLAALTDPLDLEAHELVLALAERARRFDELPEVQEALAAASTPDLAESSAGGDGPDALKAEADRLDELGARGYGNERLDQLAVEVLLGVR